MFAFTLAKSLRSQSHKVTVYSRHVGGVLTKQLRALDIPVYDNLLKLRHNRFDILHVSHNNIAYGTRYIFPHVPMVYLSHGVLPFLEQPPIFELNISKFLAISEEVRGNLLAKGIPRRKIVIFRNIVDMDRFAPIKPLNQIPKRALIFSRKFDTHTRQVIIQSCLSEGIQIHEIGDNVFDVENYMNNADIVFTRGRGAIEAMSCGRVVVVPGDGLITHESVEDIQKCNFSGRRFRRPITRRVVKKFVRQYDPALGETNREIVRKRFSADRQVHSIVQQYKELISKYEDGKLDFDAITELARPWYELDSVKLSVGYRCVKFYSSHIDGLLMKGRTMKKWLDGIRP